MFRMCLSHLIYTVRPCLIHTCRAGPMPCSDHAVILKAKAQHGRRETACGLLARVRFLPATTRSSTKLLSDTCHSQMQVASVKPNIVCHRRGKGWKQHTTKKTICYTVGLAVRIFPVDIHGHGTFGAGQGRGMICVN